MGKKDEMVMVPENQRAGTKSYTFFKPKGFRRYASPVDPSGFVFRALDDQYTSYVLRSEKLEGLQEEWSPKAFIADYKAKFVNATGSSFELISADPPVPDRVDPDLGFKYWQVEYVVRTQLGFAFDSLKSLHFITTFAAGKDAVVILNSQSLDDKWDVNEVTLKKVAASL